MSQQEKIFRSVGNNFMDSLDKPSLTDWLSTAASFSLPGAGVSRFFLSEEHRRLINWLQKLMQQCGLETTLDDSGNLIGCKPSRISEKVLYLGSHQDSVPHGGAYDGMLGILVSLLALYELRDKELPFNVEVIAFGDEEGARFQTTLLGSKAVSGCFTKDILDAQDEQGERLYDALVQFGLDPQKISQIARNRHTALGFIEVHIEQGPILEESNLPVGIVSSITGIERHTLRIKGKAGHAGTVPMYHRKDALVAASRYVNWLDNYCKANNEIVGVIGKIDIQPNSVNVIPETANIAIELRSPIKKNRLKAREEMADLTSKLTNDGFTIESTLIYSQEAMQCDQKLICRLENAMRTENLHPITLFSGAGHDGLAMGKLCPIAMLFVRCKGGISHHPDESIDFEDAHTAKKILKRFILNLASDLSE